MTEADAANSHAVEWRTRLVMWFVERLSSPDDKQTGIALISEGMTQAHSEGIGDAAEVVERLAASQSGDRANILTVASKALRDLQALNAKGESGVDRG